MDVTRLYRVRFDPREVARRQQLWQVLCEAFFQQYVGPADTVVDLGAGYCDFINHIRCRHKIAVDLSDDTARYAAADVIVLRRPSTDLSAIAAGRVDVVFASNFFEHLPTKQQLLVTLWEVRRILRPGGKLLVLQPNIRLVDGAYWDFFDHHIPLSEKALLEAFGIVGLQAVEVRSRFLPYTTKSRFPQHPWLVKAYLRLPIAQFILGKQSWMVAERPAD